MTKIKVSDSLEFGIQKDVKEKYAITFHAGNRAYYNLINIKDDEQYGIWFPKINIDDKKWKNESINNFKTIEESYIDGTHWKENDENPLRITFVKVKESYNKIYYKFVGVFEYVGIDKIDKSKRHWKRIKNEIDFSKFK